MLYRTRPRLRWRRLAQQALDYERALQRERNRLAALTEEERLEATVAVMFDAEPARTAVTSFSDSELPDVRRCGVSGNAAPLRSCCLSLYRAHGEGPSSAGDRWAFGDGGLF